MENRIELLTENVNNQQMVIGLKIGTIEISADALVSLGEMLNETKGELMEDYSILHTRVLRDMAKDGVYEEMVDEILIGFGNFIMSYCRGVAA